MSIIPATPTFAHLTPNGVPFTRYATVADLPASSTQGTHAWVDAVGADYVYTGSNWVPAAATPFADIRSYGAKAGDSTFDNQTAIEAAVAAVVVAGAGTVFIPAGTWYHSRPIVLQHDNIRVLGAGEYVTTLRFKGDVVGPHFIIDPVLPSPFVDSTRFPGGKAYDPYTHNTFLNLRDADPLDSLKNAAHFSVEMQFTTHTGLAAQDAYLLSTDCQVLSTDSNDYGFDIYVNVGGALLAKAKVGGVEKLIGTAGGALADNTSYTVLFDYDGAHLRLFLDGTIVASTAATGTLNFPDVNPCIIGGGLYRVGESGALWAKAKVEYESIIISTSSKHTSNYTPSSTRLTKGGALCGISFDTYDTVGYSWVGFTAGSNTLFCSPVRADNYDSPLTTVEIGNMTLRCDAPSGYCGQGVFAQLGIHTNLHDVFVEFCRWGIYLRNNCYFSRGSGLHIGVSSTTGLFNIAVTTASGVTTLRDLDLRGSQFGLLSDSAGVLVDGAFINATRASGLCLIDSGGTFFNPTFQFVNINDENGVAYTYAPVILDHAAAASFYGCEFFQAIPGDCQILVGAAGTHALFSACEFDPASVTYVFRFKATPERKVIVDGFYSTDVAALEALTLTNNAAGLEIRSNGQSRGTTGISATMTAANNLRGQVTVSGASTTGTVTFGSAEPDTSYYVAPAPTGSTGTPATGSNRLVTVTKNTTGFTVTVEAAPGVGNTVTFDWVLVR